MRVTVAEIVQRLGGDCVGDAALAIDRIATSQLDEVVVTNTIPLSADAHQCKKIRQLSVSFLFAETIRRITDGESVTSLFAEQNVNF